MNQPSTPAPSGASVTLTPATAGSIVLLVAFFLPWITILGANLAGFELHKIWSLGRFAWAIPVAAASAAVLGLLGRPNVQIAQLAGGLPLVFLAVALYQFGGDVFSALSFGGYVALLSGLFLLCVVPRMGRPPVGA